MHEALDLFPKYVKMYEALDLFAKQDKSSGYILHYNLSITLGAKTVSYSQSLLAFSSIVA